MYARVALMIVAIASISAEAIAAPLSFSDIKGIASTAVTEKQVAISPPEVHVDDSTVSFSPCIIYYDIIDATDRVIRMQVRLEAMRRSYGPSFSQAFFAPLIDRAEVLVKSEALPTACDSTLAFADCMEKLSDIESRINGVFNDALERHATSVGKKFLTGGNAGAATIIVTAIPQPAEIYVMHILPWIRIQKQGGNPVSAMEATPQGAPVDWSGSHMVYVRFGNGRKFGPSLVNLQRFGTLTLFDNNSMQFKGAE